jgi:large subunit ribosomal protein L13
MGKNKPTYQPNLDEGDCVIIKNVDKMKFTGKKITDKVYKHHTGYVGHLKVTKMGGVYKKNPSKVFQKAVYNMLPKNKLRAPRMKRLTFA